MLNTYWCKDFANGRLNLELGCSAVHVSTYRVSHRLRVWRKGDKVETIYIKSFSKCFYKLQNFISTCISCVPITPKALPDNKDKWINVKYNQFNIDFTPVNFALWVNT